MHDWQLLREYVEHNSQPAFTELVERHANLVYSTCLRETGDAALAEDVAQVVFLILARKAASLREGTVLAGWLFQTARFSSKNAMKQERRRHQREQKAAEQMISESEANPGWADIEPLLHSGLGILGAQERDAVLLRFFENRSLRETGAALGISEDAARMRVTRALEKLRRHFARHGFAASVALLTALLSEHAVHAAPASCLSGAAHLSGHSAPLTGTASQLSPRIASLSHHALRAMLFKKLGATAGLGVLMLASGGALSHVVKRAATQTAPAAPIRAAAPNPMAAITVAAPTKAAPTAPIIKPQIVPNSPPAPAPTAKLMASTSFLAMNSRKTPSVTRDLRDAPRPKPQEVVMPRQVASLPTTVPAVGQAQSLSAAIIPAPLPPKPAAQPAPDTLTPPDTTPALPGADEREEVSGNPASAAPPALPDSVASDFPRAGQAKAQAKTRRGAKPMRPNLRGRVLSINESDASISIKAPGAEEKTIAISPDARIFVNNQAAHLEDIQAGMGVKIRLKAGSDAFVIRAHALPVLGQRMGAGKKKSLKEAQKKNNKFPSSTP